MLKFKSRTDDEIQKLRNIKLLPKGEYEFKVLFIEETVSKKGNQQLVAKLLLTAGEENRTIQTWIPLTIESMSFLFKHFCETLGLGESYKKEELNILECIGRHGKLILGIDSGEPKPDGSGNYPDKNAVKDFVPQILPAEVDAVFNDDIPF